MAINLILDVKDTTACPLTLKESDMMPGNCTTLEVYAEQYGVKSEKKAYNVCYAGKGKIRFILYEFMNNFTVPKT